MPHFALPLTEPVAVFTVVLLVLLAAPLVGRRGVPSSVILLGAGVVLGPNVLGVLDRDPTMVLLGTVGLLYIMFLAGLEIDLHHLREEKAQSLGFGAATFLLPQLVGTVVGHEGLGLGWPASVLMGSVFASHTLLAYPAVARLGLQKERAVAAAVGATILTDTLALLVLAVIATGARAGTGADVGTLLRVVGALGAVGGIILWGLPRLGAVFFRRAAPDPAVEFVFVLAAVFVSALGVEVLGIEPVIGAFLAGLGLNRLVPEGGPLMSRIGFVGDALFIPFFLLATGMLVDPGAFAGGPEAGRAWTVALVMTGVLLATKGAAALLLRPAFGFSGPEAGVAFGLTVPQAAATLAAVLVGVDVGLFDGAVLNGTIAMVFVTCVVGPILAERSGRALVAQAETRPAAPRGARLRSLVSLANPATVGPLLDLAQLAREDGPNEPVVAMTVVPSGPDSAEGVVRAERLLSAAVIHGAGASLAVQPLVRVETNVARALARAAVETRAGVVVMGWDGSAAAERLLFGTVPDRVLEETPASVVVARGVGTLATVRRLWVAVPPLADLEPGFRSIAQMLGRTASRCGAGLVVVTPEAGTEAVVQAFVGKGRPVPEAVGVSRWRDVTEVLAERVRSSDALALVSARHGSVAWQASLEGLPRTLARRHPDVPFLVVYAGQVPASLGATPGLSSDDRAFLDRLGADRFRLGVRGESAALLFADTLGDAVPVEERAAIAETLAAPSPDVPAEIRPGVLFGHARSASVDHAVLCVGATRDDTHVPEMNGEVGLVVALIVPPDVPSSRYLRWLALTARMLRDDATVAAVRAAPTSVEARAALLASLQTSG